MTEFACQLEEIYAIPVFIRTVFGPIGDYSISYAFGKGFRFPQGIMVRSQNGLCIKEIPLNVMLTMIIVVLGLSATLITPILPLFALGAIAFFLPFGRRATIKFLMLGALSIALGALTTVDLPLSLTTTMRLEGSLFTTTYLGMLDQYSIFGIAAIGILSLFFLKADLKVGPIVHKSELYLSPN